MVDFKIKCNGGMRMYCVEKGTPDVICPKCKRKVYFDSKGHAVCCVGFKWDDHPEQQGAQSITKTW